MGCQTWTKFSTIAFLVLALYENTVASQQSCGNSIVKIGCRSLDISLRVHALIDDKNNFNSNNLQHSIDSLVCRCVKLAKSRGFTYIALRDYDLCVAGNSPLELKAIKASPNRSHCVGFDGAKSTCDDCALPKSFDYFYEIPSPVDGKFGPWTASGSCTVSCGKGVQMEVRQCNQPAPKYGGKTCQGITTRMGTCQSPACSVDGGFTDWSSFGSCNKPCGGGTKIRTRTCTNPTPQGAGKKCTGSTYETTACNTHSCDIDGGFTNWSQFGPCDKTCGQGRQLRTRTCSNPKPVGNGNMCTGPTHETKMCMASPCYGPVHRAIVCEHDHPQTIQCPQGQVIDIVYANYGRTQKQVCYTLLVSWHTNCRAGTSMPVVKAWCQGKQVCTLTSGNSQFGEPCFLIRKYLEVKYRCKTV